MMHVNLFFFNLNKNYHHILIAGNAKIIFSAKGNKDIKKEKDYL